MWYHCAIAINLQNSGDVSRLKGEENILRKKDKTRRGKKIRRSSRQLCRAPGSDLEKEREIERLRSIARRLARDAEKFLTVAFLPVSPPVTQRRARARRVARKKRIYARHASTLTLTRKRKVSFTQLKKNIF